MKIQVQTIPHIAQRYNTVGDYPVNDAAYLIVNVSELGDWRMEALIAVHEIVEALICRHQKIENADIDDFDQRFEFDRPEMGYQHEPGDDSRAPYYAAHQVATGIERILARELGVDWLKYEEKINELSRLNPL